MDRRAKERLVGASMLVALIVVVVPELLSGPKPTGQPAAAPAAAVRTYTVDLADKLPAPATASSDSLSAADGGAASQAGPIPSGANPAGTPPGGAETASGALPAARSATAESDLTDTRGDAPPTQVPPPSQVAPPPQVAPAAQVAPTANPPRAAAPPRAAMAPPRVESPAASPLSPVTKPSHVSAGGWTVQLGSFASEENADRLAHQLKVKGYPVYVLSSGSGAMLRHRVRMGPLSDRDAALRMVAKLESQGQPATLVPP